MRKIGEIKMNLETLAKQKMIEKYGSVRKFSIKVGMPYTTILSGLERGILSMTKRNADLILGALDLNLAINEKEENEMQDLKVFNKEIIPVYTTDTGEKVVVGRELHERLGIGKKYADWFKDMCGYGFEEGESYFPFSGNRSDGKPGKGRTEHLMKFDMAKHIAMIQRSEIGKAIRQKLIDLEKSVSEDIFSIYEKTDAGSSSGAQALPSKRQAYENNMALAEDCIRRFGADPGLAYSIAMNEAEKDCGKSLEAYKTLLPDTTEEKGTMNATMLGKSLGHIGPREVNKMLETAGFQNKKSDGWEATEEGLKYCTMVPYTNNGHSSYRPLWKKTVIPALQSIL